MNTKESLFNPQLMEELMSKNDQQEAYEKLISASLARVIDFVKFGEAKNAALLAFSSAWILSIAGFLNGRAIEDPWLVVTMRIIVFLFMLAALVLIWSFLPRTKLDFFHKNPERARSLIFFGDIAKFEAGEYKQRLRERYFPEEENSFNQNALDDLAIQIYANSRVAHDKFRMFQIAAILVCVAIILLLIYSGFAVHKAVANVGQLATASPVIKG